MQWYPAYNAMVPSAIIFGHVSHAIILLTTCARRMADYPVYQSMTGTPASDKIDGSLDILACTYIRIFSCMLLYPDVFSKIFFCKIANFRIQLHATLCGVIYAFFVKGR